MFLHVTGLKYLNGHQLHLKFNDGVAGIVDLSGHLWGKVFEPLKDVNYFKKARLDEEIGTVCWPNEADFVPEFLYEHLKK